MTATTNQFRKRTSPISLRTTAAAMVGLSLVNQLCRAERAKGTRKPQQTRSDGRAGKLRCGTALSLAGGGAQPNQAPGGQRYLEISALHPRSIQSQLLNKKSVRPAGDDGGTGAFCQSIPLPPLNGSLRGLGYPWRWPSARSLMQKLVRGVREIWGMGALRSHMERAA